jgi:hypothetical protein
MHRRWLAAAMPVAASGGSGGSGGLGSTDKWQCGVAVQRACADAEGVSCGFGFCVRVD